MRQENLAPQVRIRPPKLLLVFKFEPTPEELAWVIGQLPDGIALANLKHGHREVSEVVYTHEEALAGLIEEWQKTHR